MGRLMIFIALSFLLLMPLASAGVVLHLQQSSAQNVQAGNMIKIPADLTNNGPCPVDCFYKYPEFPSGIDNKIGVGIRGRLDFQIQLKAASNDPYKTEIKAVCTEQKSDQCPGNTYDSTAYFDFFTDGQQASQANPISQVNPTNPEQKSQSSSDDGTTAEHVGQFIGIALVIVMALIVFILIIFGFYKLIKKLFLHGGEKDGKEEADGKRKLCAIMFTDMKGYSKEMGSDEEATLKKLWRYEKAMKEIIKEHDGKVVKTIGDAIMGDFDSAVNAVKAAVAIQSLLKKEDIKIRIGIHVGDVIHKAGDLFGDGVNIASRIESICEPGNIFISEDVYNQVKGKIKASFENLGNRPLKNIDSPPKVYKIK